MPRLAVVIVIAVLAVVAAAVVALRSREGFAPGDDAQQVSVASARPRRLPPPLKDSDEVLDDGIRALRSLVKRPPPPPPGVQVRVPAVPRLAVPYSPELHREGRCDDIGGVGGAGTGGTGAL